MRRVALCFGFLLLASFFLTSCGGMCASSSDIEIALKVDNLKKQADSANDEKKRKELDVQNAYWQIQEQQKLITKREEDLISKQTDLNKAKDEYKQVWLANGVAHGQYYGLEKELKSDQENLETSVEQHKSALAKYRETKNDLIASEAGRTDSVGNYIYTTPYAQEVRQNFEKAKYRLEELEKNVASLNNEIPAKQKQRESLKEAAAAVDQADKNKVTAQERFNQAKAQLDQDKAVLQELNTKLGQYKQEEQKVLKTFDQAQQQLDAAQRIASSPEVQRALKWKRLGLCK